MSDSELSDLRGQAFERADMTGARFATVILNGAPFTGCDLNQVVMRGVEAVDTTIDGETQNLVVNGVDVAPLVEAELDRRHPDRPKFRPTTAEGFREAWDINERLWESTVARARLLPPQMLQESVDGEWSFVSTLRYLAAFATESLLIVLNEEWWHRMFAERDLARLEERV